MKSKNKGSMIGAIVGAIFGLGGVVAGAYVSIIKPLQEGGGIKLPFTLIVTSSILALLFFTFAWLTIRRQMMKRKRKPDEWAE
jgi:hypothetical protein